MLTARAVSMALVALLSGCWSVDQYKNGVVASDAGSSDSGSSDSGVDSGVTPSPCTATHLFCDDFENGLRVGSGPNVWDNENEDRGGKLEISDAPFRPGTHSLHATVPRNDARDTLLGRLRKTFPLGTWPRLRVEMKVYIPATDWATTDNGNATFATGLFEGPTGATSWSAIFTERMLHCYVSRPSAAVGPDTNLPQSGWFTIVVDWDPAGTKQFIGSIDGTAFDRRTIQLDAAVTPPLSEGSLTLSVGLMRYDGDGNVPTPPLEMYIDDVVVDRL